jgi:hypothetical protein
VVTETRKALCQRNNEIDAFFNTGTKAQVSDTTMSRKEQSLATNEKQH